MTSATLIEETRTAWNRIAAGYDTHVTNQNLELGRRALSRVELGADVRLLDVATGTGAVAIPAAREGAAVTAIDVSPEMVGHLSRRARAEGLANVTAVVMDGEHLEFDDDSFDVAASQFGVMLFPDLRAGLGEMARVTKPGGTVLLVVFAGHPPQLEFISFFLAAVNSVAPGLDLLPKEGVLLPFRLADREALAEHMLAAGLVDLRIDTVDYATPLTPSVTGADLMNVVANSNPIGTALVGRLAPDQRAEVGRVLDGMLLERATSQDPFLHNPVHVATGVPAR
ncbi:MAG: class I SAM-dependent methyltransferase [Acidimicrobiales bacterium]